MSGSTLVILTTLAAQSSALCHWRKRFGTHNYTTKWVLLLQ